MIADARFLYPMTMRASQRRVAVTLFTVCDVGREWQGRQKRCPNTLYPGNAFYLPCDSGNAKTPVCSRVFLCATVLELSWVRSRGRAAAEIQSSLLLVINGLPDTITV